MQPYYSGSLLDRSPTMWGGPEHPDVKESATPQTYVIGDFLYNDSAGAIAIVTSSGTPAIITSQIAGQAVKAATGVAGASVNYRIIRSDDLYFVNISHETLGSAVGALTDIGTDRAIARSTTVNTTKWVVTKDAAAVDATHAQGMVHIVGYPVRSPVGGVINAITDTYALVTVKFNTWSHRTDGSANKKWLEFGS